VDVHVVPPEEPLGLAELFVAYGDRLGRIAYLLVGSTQDAEDVVATVYARIARRDLGDIEDPVAYLGRAVVNEAKSHHRRISREQRVHIRLRTAVQAVGLGASELLDSLKVLNPLERTVVVLHYYDDRTIDDIAALLDIPRGTAASAQSRALAKLRKVLEP
jgi:DNA-directed RNA polymerase specialized sigma24 family protein